MNESIAKYGSSNCGDSLRKLSGEMWDKLNDDKLETASKKKKDTTQYCLILTIFIQCAVEKAGHWIIVAGHRGHYFL